MWDLLQVLCFQEHQLNVSDVCWSNDGTVLLSGGFDHCVKEWDVSAGKALHSYSELQGFIQTVRFNPAGTGCSFYHPVVVNAGYFTPCLSKIE